MGKRGQKPQGKVKIKWSPNFAYAIGLIATDGNLSPDGRHINFTSKDLDQVNNFMKALSIKNFIGTKARRKGLKKKYFVIQFGDVLFFNFLKSIGIGPAKSKTLTKVDVPEEFYFDFLRGVFDGDGSTYSYWDKRWKSSFMFYLEFASASKIFIDWLRQEIEKSTNSKGHVTKDGKGSTYQLKYAKKESLKIFKKMYYSRRSVFLKRKYLKIQKTLAIVGESL